MKSHFSDIAAMNILCDLYTIVKYAFTDFVSRILKVNIPTARRKIATGYYLIIKNDEKNNQEVYSKTLL